MIAPFESYVRVGARILFGTGIVFSLLGHWWGALLIGLGAGLWEFGIFKLKT